MLLRLTIVKRVCMLLLRSYRLPTLRRLLRLRSQLRLIMKQD